MRKLNLGAVMKRLFAVFLVLGALMSVEALEAKDNNQPTDITQTMSKDTSFVSSAYDELVSLTRSICKKLISSSYSSISSIFNNVISVLLGLIAFFWLFKHLKTASITREEAFKAMVWVITFVIVYVLLNSRAAFDEFKQLFYIPQNIVKAALTGSLGISNVGQAMNQAFTKPVLLIFDIIPLSFNNFVNSHDWYKFQYVVAPYFTFLILVVYALYLILLFIVVIAVIIMQIYSIFLSCIYIIFLPIMIPLLLIPQTRSIFFAWVKSFIGITMYIPLTMIPISIVNVISTMMTSNANILLGNLFYYTLLGIITCLISILLLYKIPTWISELLGVANQGVGAGGAIGMLKTAGMGVGSALMGYGGGIAKNISSAFEKGKGKGLGNIAKNLATGGLYGGVAESAKSVGRLVKNGFTALGNHFSGKNLNKTNEK